MTKRISKSKPMADETAEEVVDTTLVETAEEVVETKPDAPVKKEYIGGKEIIKVENISDKLKKITDIEGSTYLEPIE